MRKPIVVLSTLSLAAVLTALSLQAEGPVQGTGELSRVVEEVESINAMRSSLAKSFTGEPDRSTFAQVCKPVGVRIKTVAQENGWKIAQMSEKYRNPANEPDKEALLACRIMQDSPELMGVWIETEMDGAKGLRYFRRIVVEEACLACHGARAERPQFVKDGYPDDRAYGFQVGDLRGVYSVFVAR